MKKEKLILVTGLMRIWSGITSIAMGLRDHDIRFLFFYQEISENYTFENSSLYDLEFAGKQRLKNLFQFFTLMRKRRPDHVEIYHHLPDPWILIGQLLITWLLRTPIVTVCTGGEILYWENHTRLKKFSVWLSFLLSQAVIIKELYMRDSIIKHRIGDMRKCTLIHNAIPVRQPPTYVRSDPEVLFLNTFKPWRNIEMLIQAAKIVLEKHPGTTFSLVGLTGRSDEQALKELVERLQVNDSVRLLPFTKEPQAYFEKASIYVLPADVVFCNNSLLEAMERGVPPVVADVPGAELIVEHEVSGLRVERDPQELARAILRLLEDEPFRLELGRGARKKIEQDFNEASRSASLVSIYRGIKK